MNAMLRVRAAFDPLGLCNPGKIIPLLRGCGEAKAIATEVPERSEPHSFRQQQSRTEDSNTDRARIEQPRLEQVRKRGLPPLFTSLARIVGDANVLSHNDTAIVWPASADEISEILKLASREGWTVRPAGGISWLKSTGSVTVSTCRLDQIVEHEPADLIAVAQAGVKLTDFNAKLAQNGQWLPLDPPDDGRATIGGVVARGIGGPQQFGYGRPRHSVIGMKVVLADGSLIKAGGRVVKNVAGYDLCKLFTGSFGSLGIITEVNFKLRPRPAREAIVIARGTADYLRAGARMIIEKRLFPVAVEIDDDMLRVRFAGNEKAVAFQVEQAQALLKNTDVVMNDTEDWKDRWDESPEATPRLDPGARALMQRIKKQLDPLGTLPDIFAADNAEFHG